MGLSRRVVGEVGLLAVLLVLVVAGSLAAQQRQVPPAAPLDAIGIVLLVAAVVVLPGRRRWPRSVFAAVVVIIGGYVAMGYAYGPVFVAASVAVFALATVDSTGNGVIAVIAAIVLWFVAVAPTSGWGAVAGVGTLAVWLIVPAWWATMRARRRDALAVAVDARRRAVDEERLELAREVHDVVAHSLTVIGVQAGAALRVFDRDPDRAREALSTIALTNRRALAELRETIDLLRAPDRDDEAERRAPVGRLAELPALIESARSAGATVDFSPIDTSAGDIGPALVERSAYRIVQEALTNALRHAPGAAVTVEVERTTDAVLVRVADDGPGLRGHPEGRGITGMRERVAAIGGALSVTGGDAGGVVVNARLPTTGGRDE